MEGICEERGTMVGGGVTGSRGGEGGGKGCRDGRGSVEGDDSCLTQEGDWFEGRTIVVKPGFGGVWGGMEEERVEVIREDVGHIAEDVGHIAEDVGHIAEDVGHIGGAVEAVGDSSSFRFCGVVIAEYLQKEIGTFIFLWEISTF
jgi:hypothetical protein